MLVLYHLTQCFITLYFIIVTCVYTYAENHILSYYMSSHGMTFLFLLCDMNVIASCHHLWHHICLFRFISMLFYIKQVYLISSQYMPYLTPPSSCHAMPGADDIYYYITQTVWFSAESHIWNTCSWKYEDFYKRCAFESIQWNLALLCKNNLLSRPWVHQLHNHKDGGRFTHHHTGNAVGY